MTIDLTSAVQVLTQGGAVAALVFVVVGFLRGDVVPGYLYRRLQSQNEKLEAMLLETLQTAHRATKLAERDGG